MSAEEKKQYDAAKKAVAEMEKGMLEKPQTFGFYASTSPHAVTVLPMTLSLLPVALMPEPLLG